MHAKHNRFAYTIQIYATKTVKTICKDGELILGDRTKFGRIGFPRNGYTPPGCPSFLFQSSSNMIQQR